jgi:MFS transporter, DHA2 family, multidrug resistance protein
MTAGPVVRSLEQGSRADVTSPSDGLPVPQRYWSMLAIGLGITMAVLDSAVANIALPTIAHDLAATPASAIWVVNAYQLAVAVALLPAAALGERYGYRRIYVVGLAVFTVGSLLCALSPDLPALVGARVLQGLGAAGLMGVNGALVRFSYPQASLGRGVGLNALVVSLAAAVGPTVASGILAVSSWEWLFAVNVPIGCLNILLATRMLPANELSSAPFDWVSTGLTALAFGLLFTGVDALSKAQTPALLPAAGVAVALAATALLVRRSARRPAPLIPVDLLRIPVFAMSVLTSICSFAAYMLAFVSLPFFFETVLHRDQVQTGLLMTPWPAAVGLVAPLAGRLSDRLPVAILAGTGLTVLTAGLAALASMSVHASLPDIVWRTALCGLGFGFFQAPNNRLMLSSAPRRRAGAAGGMLAVARLTGMTIGASLAAIVFRAAGQGAETIDLWVATAFAALGAIASLLRLGAPVALPEPAILPDNRAPPPAQPS